MVSGWRMEPSAVTAVGVLFYSRDTDRYLYVMRRDPRHPGTWGLPGGKCSAGETLLEALHRECREELGSVPDYQRLLPIERFTSADGAFLYDTFFAVVDREFQPCLNHEHAGYAWIDRDSWPRAMHPGLWNTVNLQVFQHKIQIVLHQISEPRAA